MPGTDLVGIVPKTTLKAFYDRSAAVAFKDDDQNEWVSDRYVLIRREALRGKSRVMFDGDVVGEEYLSEQIVRSTLAFMDHIVNSKQYRVTSVEDAGINLSNNQEALRVIAADESTGETVVVGCRANAYNAVADCGAYPYIVPARASDHGTLVWYDSEMNPVAYVAGLRIPKED